MKKSPAAKLSRPLQAVLLDVVLEDRGNLGQVEAEARDVIVRERDLHGEVALGGSDVDEGFVLVPGKLPRDLHVGARG